MTSADRDPDSVAPAPAETPLQAESESLHFFEAAEKRIFRWHLLLTAIAVVAAIFVAGFGASLALLIGAALGLFNYAWLLRATRRASQSLAQAAESAGSSQAAGAALALGSVARIALVTAVGYAIFRSSLQGFYAFLAGLALPVFAMCVEALYEAWHAAARNR